ncbi:MAG: DUF1501 domain-containing protein [Planctomycetes bacterium]|nr:DUF1501 domain-containing protein [Planctomycetota bacterium]
MDLHNANAYTRREFIGRGVMLASAAIAAPQFIQRSALGLPTPAPGMGCVPGVDEGRILVVVQLSGGNDGLNTVVPYGSDDYYANRPGIAIPRDRVLRLSGSNAVGLHPNLTGMKDLFDDGQCAIVQGVGYPNPNRSHFKSMDIWHTADTSAIGDGWLGRYFDAECVGYGKGESGTAEPTVQGQPGIAVGRTAPLAMQGRQVKPISFETADLFRWTGHDIHPSLRKPYEQLCARGEPDTLEPTPDANSNASFLVRTALDAQVSSDLIRKAVATQPLVRYPGSRLGRDLAMVAAMIRAGLRTRVYYVSIGGFDTHAGQGAAQGSHANLMNQFAQAVRAFYLDLKAQENDSRVLTMTFSEFGRRVRQNASGGTDHGTAAPMFLFGPMVEPGLHGRHPSLTDLDNGDLKFKNDFRCVYAAILENWMQADSRAVLEGVYRPLPIIKA